MDRRASPRYKRIAMVGLALGPSSTGKPMWTFE
jgi:hypothetical protein